MSEQQMSVEALNAMPVIELRKLYRETLDESPRGVRKLEIVRQLVAAAAVDDAADALKASGQAPQDLEAKLDASVKLEKAKAAVKLVTVVDTTVDLGPPPELNELPPAAVAVVEADYTPGTRVVEGTMREVKAKPVGPDSEISPKPPKSESAPTRDPRLPEVGTVLKHGELECHVLRKGFLYDGCAYGTLSSAAADAAKSLGLKGRHSGFIFWGLEVYKPKQATPVKVLERACKSFEAKVAKLWEAAKQEGVEEDRAFTAALQASLNRIAK